MRWAGADGAGAGDCWAMAGARATDASSPPMINLRMSFSLEGRLLLNFNAANLFRIFPAAATDFKPNYERVGENARPTRSGASAENPKNESFQEER